MNKNAIEILQRNLAKIEGIDELTNDAIVHALVDVEKSYNEIYKKIIPIITNQELSSEKIQDLLWDIREEFRHIDYHIHDSNILNI